MTLFTSSMQTSIMALSWLFVFIGPLILRAVPKTHVLRGRQHAEMGEEQHRLNYLTSILMRHVLHDAAERGWRCRVWCAQSAHCRRPRMHAARGMQRVWFTSDNIHLCPQDRVNKRTVWQQHLSRSVTDHYRSTNGGVTVIAQNSQTDISYSPIRQSNE